MHGEQDGGEGQLGTVLGYRCFQHQYQSYNSHLNSKGNTLAIGMCPDRVPVGYAVVHWDVDTSTSSNALSRIDGATHGIPAMQDVGAKPSRTAIRFYRFGMWDKSYPKVRNAKVICKADDRYELNLWRGEGTTMRAQTAQAQLGVCALLKEGEQRLHMLRSERSQLQCMRSARVEQRHEREKKIQVQAAAEGDVGAGIAQIVHHGEYSNDGIGGRHGTIGLNTARVRAHRRLRKLLEQGINVDTILPVKINGGGSSCHSRRWYCHWRARRRSVSSIRVCRCWCRC